MLKIMIVGKSGVGKTALFDALVDDQDETSMISSSTPTTGINIKLLKYYIYIKNKMNYINLVVMDTCGLERYTQITYGYMKDTHGYIVVFDVSCRQSFIGAKKWIDKIQETKIDSILLIGNRITDKESIITQEDLDSIPKKIKYIENKIQELQTFVYSKTFRNFLDKSINQDKFNSCILNV